MSSKAALCACETLNFECEYPYVSNLTIIYFLYRAEAFQCLFDAGKKCPLGLLLLFSA